MTWCGTCRAEVPAGHVVVIGGGERGSGVPTVRYGCNARPAPVPRRAFIGHRDTSPAVVVRPA